jgi:hypothetical protein
MRWLKNYLRAQLDNGTAATAGNAASSGGGARLVSWSFEGTVRAGSR